ncbi:N-methylcoclaurine 3'-monooxygenase [Handroanthus impetiginosus]|uniref:N-methylcoclaurine 3'-monooxygenase n=1 Tax=Handroanthus impetiginosus TaxID=429701 RepID=A0A2G9G5H7_9LAMI|nr:N-methylcoclaurine 3'-monooxygenase [Handroanthus impetiginosus]
MNILILLLLLPLLLFFYKHSQSHTKNLPPGPNLLIVLKNISQLSKSPHIALTNLSKMYGPLISLRLGGQIVVVASTPAIAEEVLKTHNRVFSGRFLPSVYYNVPGTKHASLVMARECNDTWKFLRGIGQKSIFSSMAIESTSPIRTMKVMEMMKFLRNNKEGKVVNIENIISATFTNIATNVLASRNLFEPGGESEKDKKVMNFFNDIIEKATTFGFSDFFPVLERVDFWTKGRAMGIYRTINLIWGDIIKERRERGDSAETKSTQDFLDVLIGHSFSNDEIGILLTVWNSLF